MIESPDLSMVAVTVTVTNMNANWVIIPQVG